jgi:predicted GNAT family acetyltransferase
MAPLVDRHFDPAAFWAAAREFLERDETGNTQLLAIGSRHAVDPGSSPPTGFTVAEDSVIVLAALLMTNGTLFVSPGPVHALRALHDAISADRVIGDIVAERGTCAAYAALTGSPYRTHVLLQLYRLDAVLPVPPAPGVMRQCDESDHALLCDWQYAFIRDANVREGVDDVPQQVTRRLQIGGGWLWEVEGTPVSHAAFRPTPIRSARIAPVYTPAEHRGRGYATALVAALSSRLLEAGRAPLYLFADASNPTANGIYRRVGFRKVGEHLHLTRADV